MINNGKWLETDALREAVLALEMVSEQASKIDEDLYRWKWVILALHNALQGFMVLALRGTNNLNVISKKDAQAWIEAYDADQALPSTKLDDFLSLYKKIKSDAMLMWTCSKKYTTSGQQGWSIKKLNTLRNNFIHFLPSNYAIQISGLPNICIDCINIIRFLGWESGNIFWQGYKDLESTALQALDSSQEIMNILAPNPRPQNKT